MDEYTFKRADELQSRMRRLKAAFENVLRADSGMAVQSELDIALLEQNERRRVLVRLQDFINAEYDAAEAEFKSL